MPEDPGQKESRPQSSNLHPPVPTLRRLPQVAKNLNGRHGTSAEPIFKEAVASRVWISIENHVEGVS
jgi:hypothetical protein